MEKQYYKSKQAWTSFETAGSVVDTEGADKSVKNILLIVNTHGDEPVGYSAIKSLLVARQVVDKFDWIIGNPKATLENKRFLDVDLNMVAPGDPSALKYEVSVHTS